jgi:hypothetical protein
VCVCDTLTNESSNGSSDPYVKILADNNVVAETSAQRQTLNPGRMRVFVCVCVCECVRCLRHQPMFA